MEIKTTGDFGKKRLTGNALTAQKFLDNEVIKDSAPFVPMKTGQLVQSAIRGTIIGSGTVVYNQVYARRLYYGQDFNFSREKHPQAQAYWFEAAKAIHKEKWVRGAGKIVGSR